MEVISKVQDNCEKEFKDWIKKMKKKLKVL